MRNYIIRILAFSFGLAVLLHLPLAHAEDGPENPQTCIVSDSLTGELLDWISGNTDYDVSPVRNNMPEISFCQAGDDILYHDEHMIVEPNTEALYDTRKRRILLVGSWSQTNTRDIGNLLHELIHAVQFDNREWTCLGQPEWETYKLHEKWLAENGVEADFDWFMIYMISRCPRDIHP